MIIDFSEVNDIRLIDWHTSIQPTGGPEDLADAVAIAHLDDERRQVRAEIMRRGLDLSPMIDQH